MTGLVSATADRSAVAIVGAAEVWFTPQARAACGRAPRASIATSPSVTAALDPTTPLPVPGPPSASTRNATPATTVATPMPTTVVGRDVKRSWRRKVRQPMTTAARPTRAAMVGPTRPPGTETATTGCARSAALVRMPTTLVAEDEPAVKASRRS